MKRGVEDVAKRPISAGLIDDPPPSSISRLARASPRETRVHASSRAHAGDTRGSFLSVKVHTLSLPSPRGSTATHLDATRHSAVAMGVGSYR